MESRGLSVQDQSDDENQKKDKTREKINCGLNRELNIHLHPLLHLVWGVLVLVQKHFELADADVQIPVCELIGNVKSQWAKLPSLQCNSMEETQRQEQRLELRRLRGERGEE